MASRPTFEADGGSSPVTAVTPGGVAAKEQTGPVDRDDRALRALMVAYQGGDMEAFEALYGAMAGGVVGYLRALTRDATRADDLLQETFLHLHRSRHTYDPARPVRPWIYAIAHNVFLMARRAAGRLGRHEAIAQDELPEVAVPAEVESLADRDAVRYALALLPLDRREAVVLHHVLGLSFDEVGKVQGGSAGAARVRAHRGMKELRALLTGKAD
jgi:RNA polymerase sigma-70 factor, ECF subfamily